MGLGWRVEWGFGLWFFHLHLTMVWVYMGVLRPSKWREKKSQARADCVRPSRVPTSMGERRTTFAKACMESWLSTVQVEIEQWTVHSPHQTKLANKIPFLSAPSPPPTRQKGRPLHCMTQLLIGCVEILFLKLAANIFGLDE
jgi:hypothetical protein